MTLWKNARSAEFESLMIHGIEPAEWSTLPKNGCYVCGATFSLV